MAAFDDVAKIYDEWYKTKLGIFVDSIETECAFKLMNGKKSQHYLDAGCGTGNFSKKLIEKGLDVTGIDISLEMLSIAKEKVASTNFMKMNFYDLKFNDNAFDGILSMAAFEFIKEPQKAIDELIRVLKPGGELIIGTINPNSPWGEMYQSKAFEETVFQYAIFHTIEELSKIHSELIVESKICLFTPPSVKESEINGTTEKKFREKNNGGFYLIKWVK